MPIVEEDAASELVYDGDKLPPIKAFDTTGNVIYIYSFSLTFIPGLSLAFVTGNTELPRLRAADGLGLDDAKAPRHVP